MAPVSMLNQTGTPSLRRRRTRWMTSRVGGIQVMWPDAAVIVMACRLRVSRSAMGAMSATFPDLTTLRIAASGPSMYLTRASKSGLVATSACTFSVGSSCWTRGTTMRQSPSSSGEASILAYDLEPFTTHSEMPPVTAREAEPAPRRATSESSSRLAFQP